MAGRTEHRTQPGSKPSTLAVISLLLSDDKPHGSKVGNKQMDISFNKLIGEQLSSVTFVQDYLQVDFDGMGFTFFNWPIVTIENYQYKFGDQFYRDKLCTLIAKIVTKILLVDKQEITIAFNSGDKLHVSFYPDIDVGPEIAIFTDRNGQSYQFN